MTVGRAGGCLLLFEVNLLEAMNQSPKRPKRAVFITGGSGSLGRALVRLFADNDYAVTFQYRHSRHQAETLQAECPVTAVSIDFSFTFDLPDAEFDIVINNAGINICNVPAHAVPLADWDLTLRINTTVPFMVVQRYLPGMVKRRWGRIINISSIYGLRGVETNLPYNVSKHGLSGLTKTLAKEYAAYGITCNEICPGPIESDMMQQVARRETSDTDKDVTRYLKEVAQEVPAQRMATPGEVAAMALFLASEEAGYINGSSVVIDGGLIA